MFLDEESCVRMEIPRGTRVITNTNAPWKAFGMSFFTICDSNSFLLVKSALGDHFIVGKEKFNDVFNRKILPDCQIIKSTGSETKKGVFPAYFSAEIWWKHHRSENSSFRKK